MRKMDLKLAFLGMNGFFSVLPFRALLSTGLKPEALVIPSPPGMGKALRQVMYPAPGAQMPEGELNLLQAAARHGVPVYEIGTFQDQEALDLVGRAGADIIVTACFPRLLPEAWLDIPRLGALNLHPSLLPAYRGPQPLFWQFRAGENHTGVTLHFMDAGADTGDIVAQAEVPFADGISEAGAEALAGQKGAELLLAALADPEAIPRRPQPAAGASRQPAPGPGDLVIRADWPVRRAYNFMRAARAWGPFEVEHAGGRVWVAQALEFSGTHRALPAGDEVDGSRWLEMRDGAIRVRLAGP